MVDKMNREQRRKEAKAKKRGETHADVLAKRRIGQETLRMAMEDQAVQLAADIYCQRQLWAAVVALNEQWQFGPKRTRDFLEQMEKISDEFEEMKKKHGDAYAEEKLRERAQKVSGVEIYYQHEVERMAYEKMKAAEAEAHEAE
jgi:hypothetical protein